MNVQLTHENFRIFLAKVLFKDKWEENLQYIGVKDGNFVNPFIVTKTNTFVLFKIKRTYNLYTALPSVEKGLTENKLYYNTPCFSIIELQFVGVNAEAYALSSLLWSKREDIATLLLQMFGGSLSDNKRKVIPALFAQEGGNSLYSYNTELKILWDNYISAELNSWESITVEGNLYFN